MSKQYKLSSMDNPIADRTEDGYDQYKYFVSGGLRNPTFELKKYKKLKNSKEFIQTIAIDGLEGKRSLVRILEVLHQKLCKYLIKHLDKYILDNNVEMGKHYTPNYSVDLIDFKSRHYKFSTNDILGFCPIEPITRIMQLLPFLDLTPFNGELKLPEFNDKFPSETIKIEIDQDINDLIKKYDKYIQTMLEYLKSLCSSFTALEKSFSI